MAKRDRTLERLEARIASIASTHLKGEHVDRVMKSLARSIAKHVPNLDTVHPDNLTNDMIAGYVRGYAARHPDRAVAPPAPEAKPASLATAQDAAIAARAPSVRSRTGSNEST